MGPKVGSKAEEHWIIWRAAVVNIEEPEELEKLKQEQCEALAVDLSKLNHSQRKSHEHAIRKRAFIIGAATSVRKRFGNHPAHTDGRIKF